MSGDVTGNPIALTGPVVLSSRDEGCMTHKTLRPKGSYVTWRRRKRRMEQISTNFCTSELTYRVLSPLFANFSEDFHAFG